MCVPLCEGHMYTCGCVFFWAQEARCLVYWKEYVCGPGTVSFCAESEGEKCVPVQGVHCVTLQGAVCVGGEGVCGCGCVWVCMSAWDGAAADRGRPGGGGVCPERLSGVSRLGAFSL